MARLTGSGDRPRPTHATSAGGIVVRFGADGTPEIVLGRRRRQRDGVTWTLPKGTPIEGESVEDTALREVREETGLDVRIVEPVGSIEYDFLRGGTRIHKIVHHFLMDAVGGDMAAHDHEFEEVRWLPLGEAMRLLSFETERDLVEQALPAIESLRARAYA